MVKNKSFYHFSKKVSETRDGEMVFYFKNKNIVK